MLLGVVAPKPTLGATAPQVTQSIPAANARVESLSLAEILFANPVRGVDDSDLLINGTPSTNVTEVAPGHFIFLFDPPAPGDVELRWRPDHGITDDTDPGLAFAGGSWTVHLDPSLARFKVTISEFMADDDLALYDDDCDRSDWIEIHNGSSLPVNLQGWSLTDDALDVGKWKFPVYVLEPDAYLIVFASQKNKTNLPPRACRTRSPSMAGFHTNFRLNPAGEYLGLASPEGEIISDFAPAYPPQRRDVSYGRDPGSADRTGYFTKPTPRAPNSSTGAGFAPPIHFSRPGIPFIESIAIRLNCDDTNAVIRYTLDGTFPADNNASLRTYSAPIVLTTTTQVRARAFLPGLLPGPPASETYLMLTNDPAHLASFTSSLPILVLTTLRSTAISSSINTTVHASLFEPRDGRASLLGRPTLTTRAGIRIRGSSTSGQPQSPYALEWWDEFNEDLDLETLGMPAHSEWVLYAPNEFDAGLIHNPFTMELSRQMNFYAPRTRFVEVYINKGGIVRSNDWFGLYVLMEKPGISKGRINIPKAAPEDTTLPEVTGSYLFKTDRLDPGDSGFSAGGAQNCYVEPKEREMKSPQRLPQVSYLAQFFRELDTALRPTNPLIHDPVRGYRGYLAVTNWVDYHILELLSGQVDAIRLSSYFYKPRDGKLEYGPRWDYDRAWESKGDSRDDNPRVWDTGGGLFGPPWWNRLLADRDAWQLWIDRYQGFRRTTLSLTNMFARIDSLTNEVTAVQPRQARRWASTLPRASYRNEIGIMKTWISNRVAWIDSQLAQPPIFSVPGSTVTPGYLLTLRAPTNISNPANVAIYYTLDGSDPRPENGTSAPVAFRYSQPIAITRNTRVTARLRDTGRTQRGTLTTSTWSSPVAASYITSAPALLPTEIMFAPYPPLATSPWYPDDFEYLELRNISDQTLDLAGYQFTAGIHFLFTATNPVVSLAPGQHMVLARNPEAFATRYPGLQSPVAGPFTGSLSNAGEPITLTGPAGETVFSFTFSSQGLRATEGLGFSLVLSDETTPTDLLGQPDRWRASTYTGGSPGRADPTPGSEPPHVVINEVLAAPLAGDEDWIELHNPESYPADVSGWWLTDTLADPLMVRLPANSLIPPGGYLVVPGSLFHPAPGIGFGLNSSGDEIWLLSANPVGEPTGWVHGFAFGPSATGVALGRQITTDGRERLYPTTQPTRGSANAPTRVGPVIFSEIAVHRSSAALSLGVRDPFVELWNISDSPIPLFDPGNPDRTWHLRGDLDFVLPAGITLQPDTGLVLVGFDPELDPYETAGFRAIHALDESVRILGPWKGVPSTNGTVHLRLLQPAPATPSNAGSLDHLLVEETFLSLASGIPMEGFLPAHSLSRRIPAGMAADNANWRPSLPTPGTSDIDANGLPDDWEAAHSLKGISALAGYGPDADPDGDGFSNHAEYHNGTDPRNRDSALRLRFVTTARGLCTAIFNARPGRTFAIDTLVDPSANLWEVLQTLTVPDEGTVTFSLQTRAPEARFIRIRSLGATEASPAF